MHTITRPISDIIIICKIITDLSCKRCVWVCVTCVNVCVWVGGWVGGGGGGGGHSY